MSSELTPELELFKAVPGSGEPFRTTDLNDNADKVDAFAASVLAPNFVTRTRIAIGAVGSQQLDTYSVVSSKIAPESVTSAELASNSVGSDELQPNSVGASELQSNSVIESKLASGSVSNAKLQGGLDASKLQFGTLNPYLLPEGGVDASRLAPYLDLTSKGVYVSVDYGSATSAVNLGWVSDALTSTYNNLISNRRIPTRSASGSVTATPSSGLITVDLTGYGFTAAPVVTANIFGAASTKFVVTINSVSATQVVFKVWTSAAANATVSTRVDWQAIQD
jgi:hypothetical protein